MITLCRKESRERLHYQEIGSGEGGPAIEMGGATNEKLSSETSQKTSEATPESKSADSI